MRLENISSFLSVLKKKFTQRAQCTNDGTSYNFAKRFLFLFALNHLPSYYNRYFI